MSEATLQDRIEKIEDYLHKLGKAVQADLKELRSEVDSAENHVDNVINEFEDWIINCVEDGVREVKEFFGLDGEAANDASPAPAETRDTNAEVSPPTDAA